MCSLSAADCAPRGEGSWSWRSTAELRREIRDLQIPCDRTTAKAKIKRMQGKKDLSCLWFLSSTIKMDADKIKTVIQMMNILGQLFLSEKPTDDSHGIYFIEPPVPKITLLKFRHPIRGKDQNQRTRACTCLLPATTRYFQPTA